MKSAAQKTGIKERKHGDAAARAIPLVVPHGGAGAGSDFESAFEVVRPVGRARALWRADPIKRPMSRD